VALSVWTVAELGAFYTEHRSELLAHANRVLKDSAKAEEITQDSLIKFMLAAPELESEEHALSYLHRTIENLCIDHFRMEGCRPSLVVIDDAQAEVEATWQVSGDHSEVISQAEDAAIIRQALALLSPAQRAALVMWEMEGRSTEEIAAELGIKESAVRHTVSRARASLRRVLSELVIDQERGLTALDMLSTTYKKAAKLAAKSSKVALSLLIVLVAFLGFNSVTGREVLPTSVNPSQDASQAPSATSTKVSTLPSVAPTKSAGLVSGVDVKASGPQFPGLDANGIPSGFTVTDGAHTGLINVTKSAPVLTNEGLVLHNTAMTVDNNGPAVLVDQNITVGGSGTTYDAAVSLSVKRNWSPVVSGATNSTFERLADGNYLLTAVVLASSTESTGILIPVSRGTYQLATRKTTEFKLK